MKKLLFLLFLGITMLYTKPQENTVTEIPRYLFKIASPEQWKKSQFQQYLILTQDDTQQFIHFSTQTQFPKILEKYWSNKNALILKVETAKLPGNFVLEVNKSGGEKYYHLYKGSIPLAAIVEIHDNTKTKL